MVGLNGMTLSSKLKKRTTMAKESGQRKRVLLSTGVGDERVGLFLFVDAAFCCWV